MPVILFRGGKQTVPADDEKAIAADQACKIASDLLQNPQFNAQATFDQKASLQAALDRASFDLAVYRGELWKQQNPQNPGTLPPAFATSTTMGGGGDIGSGLAGLAIACLAAIAALVIVNTPSGLSAGHQLERSMGTLNSTAEQIKSTFPVGSSPIPLDSSPSFSPAVINMLKLAGVLIGAEASMAIDISKIEELIKTINDQIEANVTPQGRMRCSDSVIKFRQKTSALRQAIKGRVPFTILRALDDCKRIVHLSRSRNPRFQPRLETITQYGNGCVNFRCEFR